jgi:hypothetical protein
MQSGKRLTLKDYFAKHTRTRHVVKHGLDSLVKHGLDPISKTWTRLVKHGLY